MTISGERRAEKVEDTDTWYLSERSYGNFSRSFTLPDDADMDNVQAELREGVLNLRVPRSGENKPRQIPLRGGSTSPKA
jgi:HSP20 family protein